MDVSSPNRTETEALAAQSAAAVQALRTRAQRLLDERPTQLAEIEERIAAQLEMVGAELAHDALAARSAAATDELEALTALRSEVGRERTEWDQLRQQQETELTAARQEVANSSRELAARDAKLADQSAKLTEHRQHLAQQREEAEQRSRQIERELSELAAARAEFAAEQQLARSTGNDDLAELRRQWEQEQSNWETLRNELESRLAEQTVANDQLRSQIADHEARLRTSQDAGHSDLAAAQEQLAEQSAAWQVERAELVAERDALLLDLRFTREQVEALEQQQAAGSAGLSELQSKFDLALEDVRRVRGQVSELEQELATRPESDHSELPELIQLRTEREELVERVAMLQTRLANEASPDAAQDIADLRRRFELAVEDVRQLKKEKARLEHDLSTSQRSPSVVVESVGTDWEAQKRRLLASLEGESSPTHERQKERASIDGTIRITDEVVAEKDREIELLRQQIEELDGKTNDDRILDSDEIIRLERERLVALEAELHEKLRAAELELSVGRARITRQQSELEQQRIELEAFKKAGPSLAASGTRTQEPKRRWLDKLGLGGDQER